MIHTSLQSLHSFDWIPFSNITALLSFVTEFGLMSALQDVSIATYLQLLAKNLISCPFTVSVSLSVSYVSSTQHTVGLCFLESTQPVFVLCILIGPLRLFKFIVGSNVVTIFIFILGIWWFTELIILHSFRLLIYLLSIIPLKLFLERNVYYLLFMNLQSIQGSKTPLIRPWILHGFKFLNFIISRGFNVKYYQWTEM